METPKLNLITQWQSYLTNISSNLMELSDQTEYQLIKLKVSDSSKGFTGITRERAIKCVESVGALWRYFAVLSEVVEKAAGLENKQSFLYNPENDIKELLEKTAVVIDTEHVAIHKRNLLEDENDEKRATPKELLKYMQESFESVCKDIAEISKSEEAVSVRLSNVKNEIEKLTSNAKRFGITSIPFFDTGKLGEIERDPLRGMQELDKLVYNVEKFRASIKDVEQEYDYVEKTLERIKGMLSELRGIAIKSKNAAAESQKVFIITKDTQSIIGEDIIKSLEDWFYVLKNKLSEGNVNAVKIGAGKLEQECYAKLQREKQNLDSISREYNEWQDLKGQFKALLIKADMLKSRGLIVDNSLEELIKKTDEALHTNPVNMDNCRALVKKFMSSL